MVSTLLSRALGVAFFGLIVSNRANGSKDYIPNDVHCPEPYSITFLHNSYAYIAPLDKFKKIVGSFYDASWYGGDAVNVTTGTENVPGSTRSGPVAGTIYKETLTRWTEESDSLIFSFTGDPFKIIHPNRPAATFHAYAETTRFQSICDGTATYIDSITHICTNNPIVVYNAWYILHRNSFTGMADRIGARVLPGDCPRETAWIPDVDGDEDNDGYDSLRYSFQSELAP
ncbi:hypothetical protein B0H12DRAFT_1065102 [Mycena haematopus]|nr:hypothetical protein B0H12DRAFT_1065102 [Mycena haematopus]